MPTVEVDAEEWAATQEVVRSARTLPQRLSTRSALAKLDTIRARRARKALDAVRNEMLRKQRGTSR